MANYSSNLKSWGATGQEFPDNYSYIEDEAPVDDWDNFTTHNLISDVRSHLIPLTNSRIETDYGTTRPSSPEDGHVFYDSGAPVLEQYRAADSSWHALALDEDLDAHVADTTNPHAVSLEQARAQNSSLSGNVGFGGNNLLGVNRADFNSGDVRVNHAARNLLVEEYDGTSWTARLSVDETGASVTGALSVSSSLSVSGSTTLGGNASFGGSNALGVGLIEFSDSDGDTNQWTATEDGTSGNLEVRHAGSSVLDVGSSIVDVLGALRETGDRVATRPWIQSGFTMSGTLETSGQVLLDPTSDSLADGGSVNSNSEILRGYYDSDGTTSVTATGVDAELQHVANSDGSSVLDGRVQGADVFRGHSSGMFEVPNGDLRLATGQSVEDGSGVERISLTSNFTIINDEAGTDRFVARDGGVSYIKALSDSSVRIYDGELNGAGVQYDTGTSSGVLRTPNAGARIESDGQPSSGEGLELLHTTGTRSYLWSRDRTGGTWMDLRAEGSSIEIASHSGLIDASIQPADLRLATGQAIEDGSGNPRLRTDANVTRLYDDVGTERVKISDSGGGGTVALASANLRLATGQAIEDGSGTERYGIFNTGTFIKDEDGVNQFVAQGSNAASSGPQIAVPANTASDNGLIRDAEGGFDALQYDTNASAPGTLELTNANLDMASGDIWNVGDIKWRDADGDGNDWNLFNSGDDEWMRWYAPTTDERFRIEDGGDVVAWDNAGNKTILT